MLCALIHVKKVAELFFHVTLSGLTISSSAGSSALLNMSMH